MLTIRLRFTGPASGSSGNYLSSVRTVEAGAPLSGSILWRLVPSDAVQTRTGAGARAATAIRLWAERSPDIDRDQPIDVLELSAGDGTSSRELAEGLFTGNGPSFRLLVTDPDQRTAELLARDKVLRPLIRAGHADVARFDPALDPLVATITRGDNLVRGLSPNPLVVVSHGDLGRRPADLLRFDMGRMREALVMLTGPTSIPDPPRTRHLHRLILEWRWRAVDSSSYQDDRIRGAVEEIADELDEGAVPIPIGAVHAIDRLRALAGERLLLIAEEGGSDDLEALMVPEAPSDGIALPTNLYALTYAVEQSGGQARTQAMGDGESAFLVSFGLSKGALGGLEQPWASVSEVLPHAAAVPESTPMLLLDLDLASAPPSTGPQRDQVQAALDQLQRLVDQPDLAQRVQAWLASSDG